MFTKVILENFLSFQQIEFDLSDSAGKPKNITIVYGENGSGKSNLATAFQFLNRSIQTMSFQKYVDEVIVNEKTKLSNERLVEMLNAYRIDKLVEQFRMYQTSEPMRLMFQFMISNRIGQYEMVFNENQITSEFLRFQLDTRMVTLFSNHDHYVKISESLITDKGYAKDVLKKIERYFGKHTFLSMMVDEFERNNEEFMKKALHPALEQIIDEFFHTSVLCHIGAGVDVGYCESSDFDLLNNLDEGRIAKDRQDSLLVYEKALNDFFLPLYTDIKKVFYTFTAAEEDKLKYYLHFTKHIYGKTLDIPYDHESTGTLKLLQLFPFIFEAVRGANVVIDEMDTGIHDILISTVIANACKSVKGQLILTTHNTTLLETLKDYMNIFYVIDVDAYGNKTIVPIGKAGSRIQKNHNLRNRYLDGIIGGAPMPGYFDMEQIVQETESTYGPAKS